MPVRAEGSGSKKHTFADRAKMCFMCKDYKKDIFGNFAYEFELSQLNPVAVW